MGDDDDDDDDDDLPGGVSCTRPATLSFSLSLSLPLSPLTRACTPTCRQPTRSTCRLPSRFRCRRSHDDCTHLTPSFSPRAPDGFAPPVLPPLASNAPGSSTSSTLSPPTSPCSSIPVARSRPGPQPAPFTLRAITGTEHCPAFSSSQVSSSQLAHSSTDDSLSHHFPHLPPKRHAYPRPRITVFRAASGEECVVSRDDHDQQHYEEHDYEYMDYPDEGGGGSGSGSASAGGNDSSSMRLNLNLNRLRPRISSVTDISAASPHTSRTDCAAYAVPAPDRRDSLGADDRARAEHAPAPRKGGLALGLTPDSTTTASAIPRGSDRNGNHDEQLEDDNDNDNDSTYSHASAVNLDDLDDDDLEGLQMHSDGSGAAAGPAPAKSKGHGSSGGERLVVSRAVLDMRRQSFANSLARAREAKTKRNVVVTVQKQGQIQAHAKAQQQQLQQTGQRGNGRGGGNGIGRGLGLGLGQRRATEEDGRRSLSLMERCVAALTEALDVNLTHAKAATERFVAFHPLYTPDERQVIAELLRETTARLRRERRSMSRGWRRRPNLMGMMLGSGSGGYSSNRQQQDHHLPPSYAYPNHNYNHNQQDDVGDGDDLVNKPSTAAINHFNRRNLHYHHVSPLHQNHHLLRAVGLNPNGARRRRGGSSVPEQTYQQQQLQQYSPTQQQAFDHNEAVLNQALGGLLTSGAYNQPGVSTSSSGATSASQAVVRHMGRGGYGFGGLGMKLNGVGGSLDTASGGEEAMLRSVVFGVHVLAGPQSAEAMLLRMAGEFQREEVTRRATRAERVDVPLSFAMALTATLATFARLECAASFSKYKCRNAASRRAAPHASVRLRTKYDGMRLSFGVTLHGECPCTVLFKRPRVFSLRKIDDYATLVTEAKDILAEFGRDVVGPKGIACASP